MADTDWSVISYTTFSIGATSVRARIFTAISYAGTVTGAVSIQDAFWATRAVWVTDIVWRTDAFRGATYVAALGVHTAERRSAAGLRRLNNRRFNDSLDWPAIGKCVAGETLATRARWSVVDNTTFRIGAAGAWARINTFSVDTGLLRWTVGTNDAFWTAIGYRADHAGKASALCDTTHSLALSVQAARRWIAWVRWDRP